MYIEYAELIFDLPHVNSLKEKRAIRRSLIEKARGKFNASIAEVASQDFHGTLTVGVAVVSGEFSHAQNSIEKIIEFMENNIDADLTSVEQGGWKSCT